jgi:hypothetical protein
MMRWAAEPSRKIVVAHTYLVVRSPYSKSVHKQMLRTDMSQPVAATATAGALLTGKCP